MKTIYEANTALDAHMIANLLEQEGIHSEILGEYLQGGTGELQAGGLVRVAVSDIDYVNASEIITEWDRKQPTDKSMATPKASSRTTFLAFFLGVLTGAISIFFYLYSPIRSEGIDRNKDGILEEHWIYHGNYIHKQTIDRNSDGKVDFISHFNLQGQISHSESDDDFDGTFEIQAKHSKKYGAYTEYDINQDGIVDFQDNFKDGVLKSVFIYDKTTKTPRKKQYFTRNKLVASDFDSDGDGIYEQRVHYDALEEPIN